MAKLEIRLRSWDEKKYRKDGNEYEGDENYFNVEYPHVPSVGEHISCKIFSKFKNIVKVSEVTYYTDRVEIFINHKGELN
jgi:hypothetical protein